MALETGEDLNVEVNSSRPRLRGGAAPSSAPPNLSAEGLDFEKYVAEIERSLIESALEQTGGVQTRAAELLKVSYRSFRHLLKKYDI